MLTNAAVERALGLPVFVSPAPSDCGLSVGGAWLVQPPPWRAALARPGARRAAFVDAVAVAGGAPNNVAMVGLPLFDLADVAALAGACGAAGPFAPEASAARVADALASGHVVATLVGRQEFGPRALGHRSLLAVPSPRAQRDKMNRVKKRQWWRPTAPVLAAEAVDKIFHPAFTHRTTGEDVAVSSPFMSHAPKLREEMRELAPAIVHFARHDFAEDFSRLNALLCTAIGWIFIPAYCFAVP